MSTIALTVVSGETIAIGLSIPGVQGPIGNNTLPSGGTVGQLIVKQSSTDYDAAWTTSISGVTINSSIASGLTLQGTVFGGTFAAPALSGATINAGTAALPSITFTGDLDTGIYSPGADQLAVSTGGTGRLFVDSSGRVGIGTSSPGAKLESYHSSTNPSLSSSSGAGLSVSGTSTVRLNIGTLPGSPFSSWLQSSEGAGTAYPIALNPLGGNVGIGTTSPARLLDVTPVTVNSVAARFGNVAGRGLELSTFLISGTNDAGVTLNALGVGSGTFTFQTDNTERLRIDSSGSVGIGTSSPGVKLHIADGQIRVANSGAINPSLVFTGSSAGASGFQIGQRYNAQELFIYDLAALADRVVVDSAGSVGIGTASPAAALHAVSASAGANSARFSDGVNSTLLIGHAATNLAYLDAFNNLGFYISGTERARIDSSGRVGIGTSSPSSLLHLADAGDITVGTTTGTKIGTATTQKIGFYNATPVVQPTAVADATDAASVITQLNALLTRMRNLGLIAT